MQNTPALFVVVVYFGAALSHDSSTHEKITQQEGVQEICSYKHDWNFSLLALLLNVCKN